MAYLELGPTPYNEDCAQVGTDNYSYKAGKECNIYSRQLWRFLKDKRGITQETAPYSFNIITKSFPHDFGSYYEVCAKYSDGDEVAIELAFWLEDNLPGEWDEEAKKELQ